MGDVTLFGVADDPAPAKPRTPVPEWLVKELIALGCDDADARGYDMRQAYAVRGRLVKARDAKPVPEPFMGASLPERLEDASHLAGMLAAGAPADRLASYAGVALLRLSDAEVRRVAAGLERMLRDDPRTTGSRPAEPRLPGGGAGG